MIKQYVVIYITHIVTEGEIKPLKHAKMKPGKMNNNNNISRILNE